MLFSWCHWRDLLNLMSNFLHSQNKVLHAASYLFTFFPFHVNSDVSFISINIISFLINLKKYIVCLPVSGSHTKQLWTVGRLWGSWSLSARLPTFYVVVIVLFPKRPFKHQCTVDWGRCLSHNLDAFIMCLVPYFMWSVLVLLLLWILWI